MPFEFDRILAYGEIFLGFFQYLSILVKLDIGWPRVWKQIVDWVKVACLDIRLDVFNVPAIDYRTYFLLVAVVLPLAVSFVTLLFFKSPLILAWYFVLLCGLAGVVVGAFTYASPNYSLGAASAVVPPVIILIAGIVVVVVCIVIFAIYVVKHKQAFKKKMASYRQRFQKVRKFRVGDAPEETVVSLKKKAQADAAEVAMGHEAEAAVAWSEAQMVKKIDEPRRSVMFFVSTLLTVALLVAVGLFIVGVFDLSSIPVIPVDTLNPVKSLGKVAGYIMLAVSGLVLLYVLVNIPKAGRNFLRRVRIFFDKQFIRIILFVLLLTYIPVANVLLTSWACAPVTCPAGYTLPYKPSKMSAKAIFVTTLNSSLQCVPCSFATVGCPWSNSSTGSESNCTCAEGLCQGVTEVRFQQDSSIMCSEVRSFFGPIAVVMGVGFVIGVPLLYYVLVRYHAAFLQQMSVPGESLEERWSNRLTLSQNSAKTLYISFEYKWRYFKVGLLLQKLLVVFCSIILALHPSILSICLCVINLAVFVLCVLTQPYVSRAMDLLSTATFLALAITSVLATLQAFKVKMPSGVFVAVAAVNFVVPIVSMTAGFIIEWVAEKKAMAKVGMTSKDKAEESKSLTKERSSSLEDGKDSEPPKTPADQVISPRLLFSIDWHLNNATMSKISTFFILLGAVSFVSLAIGLVGIFASNEKGSYIAPTTGALSLAEVTEAQFAGYSDWNDFAKHCCCNVATNSTSQTAEVWSCLNGKTKERIRATWKDGDKNSVWLSGLPLRPLCGSSFNSSLVCSIKYKLTGYLVAELCSGVTSSIDSSVFQSLW